MQLYPSFSEFSALSRRAGIVPVWREFLFDTDTAVTAYAKLYRPPFGFLLESVVGGEQWARYSFLGSQPREAWRLKDGTVSVWQPETGWRGVDAPDPLEDLDRRLRARKPARVQGLPRFWGGAVGFFGYDVARYVERLPNVPPDDLDLPDGLFLFTDVVLVIDNLRGRGMAVAAVSVEQDLTEADLRDRYEEGGHRSGELIRRLEVGPTPSPLDLKPEPPEDPPFTSTLTRSAFQEGVERIKEFIREGDAFQVVLSQRLAMPFRGRPFDLYRVLRTVNPSPYLYFLELDGVKLVGSSPEVLVRVEDGTVTVRPIAGTRPRGKTAEEDRVLAEELEADEKELAEHRMLVDLGRNDVGRVAKFGSVRVPDLMVVERYSHVMHLVSQVEGELRDGLSAMDVFKACFPAGTVSGAPKIRAMEIIDELEPLKRGPYAGAVGYFSFGGMNMDTAITIRTVVIAGSRAFVQAGAGIVADSDPSREFEETLNKARALLRAAFMVPEEG
ncbi:MAG: anthranilate synthase component I [Gemmatimonadales bacterium]|nr:MAG: anthranilate synthase component I [Gemmatimonadales bacterium]